MSIRNNVYEGPLVHQEIKKNQSLSRDLNIPGLQTIMKRFERVEEGVERSCILACSQSQSPFTEHTFWDMPGKRMGWTRYGEYRVCGEFSSEEAYGPRGIFGLTDVVNKAGRGRSAVVYPGFSGDLLASASLVVLTSPWCDIQELNLATWDKRRRWW